MTIDTYYSKAYQRLFVDPILPYLRIAPNYLTAAALMIGIATLPLLAYGHLYFAAICLLFSGYLDTLDGSLARFRHLSSPVGSVYDIISDRIVEFSVIMGLYFYAPEERSLLSLLMLGSILVCVTSFLVVGQFKENQTEKSFYYSPGLMERAEAFIFFLLMILLPSLFSWLAALFTLFVAVTALTRVVEFSNNSG